MSSWTPNIAASELLAILPFINRMMAVELRQETGEETTMVQFRVLSQLVENPLTLSVLAKKRRVSLQAAGELVQGLVDRGWVIRMPDATDRRQSLLSLTDEGEKQYHHAQQRMTKHLVQFMEKLTPDEMSAVQLALPALRRVLSGDQIED